MTRWIELTAAAWTAAALACGAPESAPAPGPTGRVSPGAEKRQPAQDESLVARGKRAYMSNCIACHNTNPGLDGGLGPAVSGASRELLEARIRGTKYRKTIPKRRHE